MQELESKERTEENWTPAEEKNGKCIYFISKQMQRVFVAELHDSFDSFQRIAPTKRVMGVAKQQSLDGSPLFSGFQKCILVIRDCRDRELVSGSKRHKNTF